MTDGLLGVIPRARSSRIVQASISLMLLLIVLGGVAVVYSALMSGVAL